jgi:uncharacterized protein (DUF924 family)
MRLNRENISKDPSTIALDPCAQEVLDYWFGTPDSPEYGRERALWFAQSDAVDADIRTRFLVAHQKASAGHYDAWTQTPLGACALIIILDQFSRNLYRGQAAAFAADAHALAIARKLVEQGKDRDLPTPCHRSFIYLPFEHDESIESQRESLRLFEALKNETGLASPLEWAIKHAVIINRFGRYPHRNLILGRTSSAEEKAFLQESGSSF